MERLTHRGATGRPSEGQRWIYLVVVLVAMVTWSKGAQSVCTAHSCVTWRGCRGWEVGGVGDGY